MLMFPGAVFVTCKDSMSGLKKWFLIQSVLKGHTETIMYDELWIHYPPLGWVKSGTNWAVMRLHIVISDFIVKGSMFILSFCSSVNRGQCGRKEKMEIKAVQTASDSLFSCLMLMFSTGLKSPFSLTCLVTVLSIHTGSKHFFYSLHMP